MRLLPAIDLIDGQCVRLYQGDYAQVTTYASDPVEVARHWQEAGASWLHVVDLDGAKAGQPMNAALIERLCRETTLHIEVGGGLRTLEQIASTLAVGVERVILGTAALNDRELLTRALQRWGEHIVVGIDARDGLVAIRGWRETSSIKATELAVELSAAGVRRFIYTDIARDGAMQGPNLAALRAMLDALQGTESTLIASGGVSSLADLQQLATLEIEGAIIGKALYTDTLDLAEAVQTIEREGDRC
ncbi:MAG TPA: 1-(5-phosphoribosyl)-5-[(5-phosphoribosylamino)methylideneamino]imidazole-4-carboxamide isomerase [Ktedonobacteraceae bacterium]|jgi:phosphoribosylformimino-5-aminoimidazole carboxamide ribotide isomerase|nr:1-(5-phosphoribosyl)-5-[(5-phosphoribosylamino)methylideneamino]imidazole-4-carboxamide isomerase [Ktedonobacteraceae bacterium]